MTFNYEAEKALEGKKLDFYDEVKSIIYSRESGWSNPRKIREIHQLIKKIDAEEEALDA